MKKALLKPEEMKKASNKPEEMKDEAYNKILEIVQERSSTKQYVYRLTLEHFREFKKCLHEISVELSQDVPKIDKAVEVKFQDRGEFEAELRFGGDVLIFSMHTNIFNFDAEHHIHKLNYVEEDYRRAFCGLIQVYNFLADSIKYNRVNDIGYLIARIYMNRDHHYFVEGKRQLGFLYDDFENSILTPDQMRAIIKSAILYCLDFDLLSPPYDQVKEVTLQDKLAEYGSSGISTGKRLGFQFRADVES